ncbi:hypothetical protein GF324_07025 [bacterium]|nr:hypothetical protein [bacterium]
MRHPGFSVGNQRQAKLLFDDWVRSDFRRIIRSGRTAQFFRHIPFSLPFTYIALDHAFPGGNFILTISKDADEWCQSLARFHGKRWGNGNIPPNADDLKNATTIYKGYPYHTCLHFHNTPENEPYHKDVLTASYETHKKNVADFFRHHPDDLLIINLKNSGDYGRFCRFIGSKQERDRFPWENQSR